jgi:hypothetical protein
MQALFSKYHEVCIGDTILQMREGYEILIPLSEQDKLPLIRAFHPYDVPFTGQMPVNIKIDPVPVAICYHSGCFRNGVQPHPETGKITKFAWSYKFGYTWAQDATSTAVTMANYQKKKDEWVKHFAVSALGFKTKLYIENPRCYELDFYGADLRTPHKAFTRSEWENAIFGAGGVSANPLDSKKFRDNISKSYIECRHCGWTYKYNVETGSIIP